MNNSFPLSVSQALSPGFYRENGVSIPLPIFPNIPNSMITDLFPLPDPQTEENGITTPVNIPPTLPNTENSMFNNPFPFSSPQALPLANSAANAVGSPVAIPSTFLNTENSSMLKNPFPFSSPQALPLANSAANAVGSPVAIPSTLLNTENSSMLNNPFPFSSPQALPHANSEVNAVSSPVVIPPTLPNIEDSVFNNSFPVSVSQAFPNAYSEEDGESSLVPLPPSLPNTENSMFDNSFPVLAPQELSYANSEENGVSDLVPLPPTLQNTENSMFDNWFPVSAPQELSYENGISSPVTLPPTLLNTEFNNLIPVSAPQALSYGYSQGNGESSLVNIPPTLPKVENSMFNMGNNAGHVAVGNTSGRRRGRPLGSKNKPKGENSALKTIILNVPANVDLINWVIQYSNSKKVNLTVLCGRGTVRQAEISHMGSPVPPKTYEEPLALISFSGSYLFSSSADGTRMFFSVTLSKLNGDIVSGTVSRMITIGTDVALTVTTFQNPQILAIKATELMTVESNCPILSGRNLKWPVILSFEPGTDIIKGVVQYARYYSLMVSVLCCSGLVSEVDIGFSSSHTLSVKATGNFQIISFSGTCDCRGATSSDNVHQSFIVSLAGHNNELFSGVVVNGIKAASHITVVTLAKDAP